MPLWIRLVLFFGVLSVLVTGISVYVHRRAATTFALDQRGRRLLGGLLLLGALSLVAARVVGRFVPDIADSSLEVLAIFGSSVVLGAVISAALLLPMDALGSLVRGVKRLLSAKASEELDDSLAKAVEPEAGTPGPESLEAPMLGGRRAFLGRAAAGTALLIGPSTSVYGGLFGRHDYAIEEVPIRIPGLSPQLSGYTIVQLSDIHFGTFVGEPELRAAEEMVRRADPDLVVLTGDLVDHDPRYAPMLGRLVRRLSPLARDGVAMCPGNHDYYAGVDRVIDAVVGGGGRVLKNRGEIVGGRDGFALLGVDDIWAPRNGYGGGPDLDAAIAMVPGDLPRILLCHNPAFFPEAAGKTQLMLSGHTHGGQVQLGVNPAEWVLPYGYVAGSYRRQGASLYVNRGFGTAGPPIRVGSAPEITKHVLLPA